MRLDNRSGIQLSRKKEAEITGSSLWCDHKKSFEGNSVSFELRAQIPRGTLDWMHLPDKLRGSMAFRPRRSQVHERFRRYKLRRKFSVDLDKRTLLPLLLGPPCELARAQPPLEVLFAGLCSKSGTSSLVRSIMILVIGPGAANNVPITGPAHGRTTTDPVMYRLGGLPLCLWDWPALAEEGLEREVVESRDAGEDTTDVEDAEDGWMAVSAFRRRVRVVVLVVRLGAPREALERLAREVRRVQEQWGLQPLVVVTHVDCLGPE